MTDLLGLRCVLMLLLTAAALIGCSSSDAPSSLQATYDEQIGWSGATSKACELFTTAEVSAITGTEVVDSRMFAVDSGQCQWLSRSDFGAKLAVREARLWFDGSQLPNREALDGLPADEAYLVADDDVYVARARTGDAAVTITSSRRDSTIELLRLTLERLPRWRS